MKDSSTAHLRDLLGGVYARLDRNTTAYEFHYKSMNVIKTDIAIIYIINCA